MSRVIAAVDNSAATAAVLASARAIATVLGADVEAVHVGDEPGQTAQSSARIHRVPLRTIAGDPLDVLTGLAAADDVVAMVVGARANHAGRRPAGHVAIALADRIDKPVIIVPPHAPTTARLRRVVIAMEGTPGKARTLKRALELADTAGLDLTVVHVDDESSVPMFSDQIQHETMSYAREFLARFCRGAPSAHLELRVGSPAEEILGTVDGMHADLLAMGWPHTTDPDRGVVAREILERTTTPVLLVAMN